MHANPQSGEVTLGHGQHIAPNLTKTAFMASAMGQGASVFSQEANEQTYAITIPAQEMGLLLTFAGEKLIRVIASSERAEFGTGWDDWSMHKEKARHHAHSEWLKQIGLAAGHYAWGSVDNVLEVRFGCSSILIHYT